MFSELNSQINLYLVVLPPHGIYMWSNANSKLHLVQ